MLRKSVTRIASASVFGIFVFLSASTPSAIAAEWYEDTPSIGLDIFLPICFGINGGVESGTNFGGLAKGYSARKNLKSVHPSQGKMYFRVRQADYTALQTGGKYKILSSHVLTKQESTMLRRWFAEVGSGAPGWLNIVTGFTGFFSAIVSGVGFALTVVEEGVKYGASKYPQTLALNIDKDDRLDIRLSAMKKDGKPYLLMGTFFNSADGKYLIPVCGGMYAVSIDPTAPQI
jgi:hypothetical protein